MATGIGANIVKDGLVFAYDMGSDNSWKGRPTTNFIHQQNAVAQESYTPYIHTAGTWQANHQDAIRAYNADGGDISAYVNTGVGDYVNKFHAIWTYDEDLKKPVVTMRDADASWKAKSYGTGKTMNSAGLAYGDTYTISYLQKVNNLSKRLRVGVYGQNTSGTNGFHDGRLGAYNTKINTWERVYSTYTVSTAWNLDASLNIYMYGHYDARATIHIADVQWEKGTTSKYSPVATRSNTEALLDWTGNNAVTATSLTYNSDTTFEFINASNNYAIATGSGFTNGMSQYTIAFWARRDIESKMPVASAQNTNFYWYGDNSWRYVHGGTGGEYYYPKSVSIPLGTWGYYVATYDGSNVKIYRNGVYEGAKATTGSADWAQGMKIGGWTSSSSYAYDGVISSVNFYNKALTAQEVQQNFNALRGRYGI